MDKELARLRRQAIKSRDEFAQLARDKEYWNRTRGHEECFDVGAEKMAVKYMNDHIAELDRVAIEGGPIRGEAIKRVVEVCEAAEAAEQEATRGN